MLDDTPTEEATPEKNSAENGKHHQAVDLLDPRLLKAAGQFLGIVGAGGGGFAALTFGIGYLAVKNQDAMIGMPTLSLNYTTYLRIGALFFPNSLYYLFTSTANYLLGGCLVLLLTFLVLDRIARRLRLRPALERIWRVLSSGSMRWILFAGSHVVLLLLAVIVLRAQLASFDPVNKNLLYSQLINEEPQPQDSTQLSLVDSVCTLPKLNALLVCRSTHDIAEAIKEKLTETDGASWLHSYYGQQLGLVILLLYCAFVLRRWRLGLKRIPGLPSLSPIDWVVSPILVGLVALLVVNTPASYGVLCLSPSRLNVVITTENESASPAFLFSDLSTEPKEIWTGDRDGKRWVFTVHSREDIRGITVTEYSKSNIVDVRSSPTTSSTEVKP